MVILSASRTASDITRSRRRGCARAHRRAPVFEPYRLVVMCRHQRGAAPAKPPATTHLVPDWKSVLGALAEHHPAAHGGGLPLRRDSGREREAAR